MELKIADVAELLQVSTKTVYRWVQAEKIPFYRVNHQYRFDQQQLEAWAAAQGKGVRSVSNEGLSKPAELPDLIRRGGIHYRVEGSTSSEAIVQLVSLLPALRTTSASELMDHLMSREEMQSTGVGHGIALPHPRRPVISDSADEFIAICFLDAPVQADTVDGLPIHTMIVVVCADEIRHVRMMAQVAHLCRQPDFSTLLANQAGRRELLAFIDNFHMESNTSPLTP